jgi:hypothetical protein
MMRSHETRFGCTGVAVTLGIRGNPTFLGEGDAPGRWEMTGDVFSTVNEAKARAAGVAGVLHNELQYQIYIGRRPIIVSVPDVRSGLRWKPALSSRTSLEPYDAGARALGLAVWSGADLLLCCCSCLALQIEYAVQG